MKKIYVLLITSLVSFFLVSCGGHEEELAEQYIDACAQNDFVTANAVLDKMEIDSDHGDKYSMYEHREYVNTKEILYLIAQGDRQSANRLLFLLKEDGTSGLTKEEIVNLAITQGNDYLAGKIIDTGEGISNVNIEAACSEEMDDLVFKMLDINPQLISENEVEKYLKNKGDGTYEKLIAAEKLKEEERIAAEKLKKEKRIAAEKLRKIQSIKNNIEHLINEKLDGTRYAPGLNDYIGSYERQYVEKVSDFNMRCIQLLDNAIINVGDKNLCQQIIDIMRQNMEIHRGNGYHGGRDDRAPIIVDGVEVDGNHSYVKYTWEDKKEAKRKLDEAIKEKRVK